MKAVCSAISLVLLSTASFSQSTVDSLSDEALNLHNESTKLFDSLSSFASVNRWRDSLTIDAWSEELKNRIYRHYSPDALARSADSLRKFGVPEPAIAHHSDSILQRKMSLLNEVAEKQNTLQKKATDRYTVWTSEVRKKFNLDSGGVSLLGVSELKPNLNLPQANLPNVPSASIPDVPPMPGLEQADFSSLSISPELSSVGGDMTIPSAPQLGEWQKAMPSMPDPMGDISKQVSGIKELSANPSDAAEKALGNVSEVSEATKALNEAEELKKQSEGLKAAEQLKDPNATKEALKEQAVDHFAGKQAELQGAMSQMAKYKKKYSSINSLSEIKKKDWLPRNGLKGKPFKERFRPGMNLGYRGAGDTLLFDLFPNAAYRITGRIEAGLGGIYSLRIATDPFGFDQREPVWGVTMFAVVKTFKSVFIRFETDATSHPKPANAEKPSYRDWRWSFHTGIQTNFKLSKRLTGNVQMLYNFDSSLKDGFPEKLSARIGVQYKLK